jgi:LEA14-like dessication related protein
MSSRPTLLIAALAALGCASAPPVPVSPGPTVRVESQRIEERGQDLSGLEAVVSVRLHNTGATAVRATAARYELVTGGRVADSGRVALATDIPAGGQTEVQIAVPFRYARDEQQLAALLEQTGPIEFAVRGAIEIGPDAVEFARASAVRAPRLPVLQLGGIEAINSPTHGLTVNASIEVRNPNPFALELPGVQWALAVAGEPIGEGTVARKTRLKPASTTRYELSMNLEPGELARRGIELGQSLAYQLRAEVAMSPTVVELDERGEARLLRDGE